MAVGAVGGRRGGREDGDGVPPWLEASPRDPYGGRDCRTASPEVRSAHRPELLVFMAHGLGSSPEDLRYLKKCVYDVAGSAVLVHSSADNFVPHEVLRRAGRPFAPFVNTGREALATVIMRMAKETDALKREGDGGGEGEGEGEGAGRGAAPDAPLQAVRDLDSEAAQASAAAAGSEAGTFGGIEESGERAARELLEIARAYPSLARLTLVGNSLGGLFARYIAARLYDPERGTVAGLVPEDLVTIACPHLGTRSYAWQGAVPRRLHQLAAPAVGRSGEEVLFLDDDGEEGGPLLLRMTQDQPRMPYRSALQAFSRRTLYANAWGDSLVPYESAALQPDPSRVPRVRDDPRYQETVGIVLEEDVPAGSIPPPPPAHSGPDAPSPDPGSVLPVPTLEGHIAANLTASMDWHRVVCQFPIRPLVSGPADGIFFPSAHNKICANKRNAYYALTCHEGEEVMQHAARRIAQRVAAPAGTDLTQ